METLPRDIVEILSPRPGGYVGWEERVFVSVPQEATSAKLFVLANDGKWYLQTPLEQHDSRVWMGTCHFGIRGKTKVGAKYKIIAIVTGEAVHSVLAESELPIGACSKEVEVEWRDNAMCNPISSEALPPKPVPTIDSYPSPQRPNAAQELPSSGAPQEAREKPTNLLESRVNPASRHTTPPIRLHGPDQNRFFLHAFETAKNKRINGDAVGSQLNMDKLTTEKIVVALEDAGALKDVDHLLNATITDKAFEYAAARMEGGDGRTPNYWTPSQRRYLRYGFESGGGMRRPINHSGIVDLLVEMAEDPDAVRDQLLTRGVLAKTADNQGCVFSKAVFAYVEMEFGVEKSMNTAAPAHDRQRDESQPRQRDQKGETMADGDKAKWDILKESAKAYPPVKLAMGLVGIGFAAALVWGAFLGNGRIAVLGVLFSLALMVVLYMFKAYIADHTKKKNAIPLSAVVFVNFCVYFVMLLMIQFYITLVWGVPEFCAKLLTGR